MLCSTFCLPTSGNEPTRACPYGHVRQWMWVGVACLLPGILMFVLNEMKYTLQSLPTRPVTTTDQRFWKLTEVPAESISTVLLFIYVLFLPSLVVIAGIVGAVKRDLELRKKNDGQVLTSLVKDIPFRGWAIGIYVLVNWSDLFVTVVLKYVNHQMRPKSLAECYHVLDSQQYNMSTYVGTLEQLQLCCTHNPNLFQGYPSGHSSMAFCGLFGFGVLLSTTDWLLEGLAHVLCCCRSGSGSGGGGGGGGSGGSSSAAAVGTGSSTKEGDAVGALLNYEEGVGDCSEKIGNIGMHVLKGLILLVCGTLAALVACSRVNDGSHFPYQVTAGCLLGLAGAACFAGSDLLLKDVELGGHHREGTKVVTTAKTSRNNSSRKVGLNNGRMMGQISEHINVELGNLSPRSQARKRNTVV